MDLLDGVVARVHDVAPPARADLVDARPRHDQVPPAAAHEQVAAATSAQAVRGSVGGQPIPAGEQPVDSAGSAQAVRPAPAEQRVLFETAMEHVIPAAPIHQDFVQAREHPGAVVSVTQADDRPGRSEQLAFDPAGVGGPPAPDPGPDRDGVRDGDAPVGRGHREMVPLTRGRSIHQRVLLVIDTHGRGERGRAGHRQAREQDHQDRSPHAEQTTAGAPSCG
jgi:hypothetical protein